MRGFLILCFSTVALAAHVGYDYSEGAAYTGGNTRASYSGGGGSIGIGSGDFSGGVSGYSIGDDSDGGFAGHGAPIVSKHFYIHSAPEEHDDESISKTLSLGPGHKKYRVVFIKAPAQSSHSAAISVQQAQNQEKTVIYVLSKKTDAADIQAHVHAAPHVETKPEVFFIKYKTPEEAVHAQQTIQAQYDALEGSSHVTDEGYAPVSSVIGSLGGGGHSSGGVHISAGGHSSDGVHISAGGHSNGGRHTSIGGHSSDGGHIGAVATGFSHGGADTISHTGGHSANVGYLPPN